MKLLVAKGQHDGSFDAAWYHRGLEIAWKSKSFEIIKYLSVLKEIIKHGFSSNS